MREFFHIKNLKHLTLKFCNYFNVSFFFLIYFLQLKQLVVSTPIALKNQKQKINLALSIIRQTLKKKTSLKLMRTLPFTSMESGLLPFSLSAEQRYCAFPRKGCEQTWYSEFLSNTDIDFMHYALAYELLLFEL